MLWRNAAVAWRTDSSAHGTAGVTNEGEVSQSVVYTPATSVQTSGVSKASPTTEPVVQNTQPKESGVGLSGGLSAALLGQQLPLIPKFSGGDSSPDESFQEWITQFEFIAEVYGKLN